MKKTIIVAAAIAALFVPCAFGQEGAADVARDTLLGATLRA